MYLMGGVLDSVNGDRLLGDRLLGSRLPGRPGTGCSITDHPMVTSPSRLPTSAVHPLPAAHPLPVARVAFAGTDDLCRLLPESMGHQGGKDGGGLRIGLDPFLGQIDGEPLLDKAGVVMACDEAVGVHDPLVEGDVGLDAEDAVFLKRPAHPQNRLAAGLAPTDQL